MLRTFLPALALLLSAGCATMSEAPSAQAQISLETVQRITRELSSDAYEGRAPGTPGETRTVETIAREFERAGLQPGNNGSWYQDVPLTAMLGLPCALISTSGTS